MTLDIDDIRNAVAQALERTGHGNIHFIQSVRDGGQDDGPFMRGAFAVLDLVTAQTVPSDG